MIKILGILKLILTLLPVVVDAVKVLEAAFPQGGQGAAKLAALREIIAGAFSAAQDIGVTFEEIWPALERTVSALVGLFNKTGAFKQ